MDLSVLGEAERVKMRVDKNGLRSGEGEAKEVLCMVYLRVKKIGFE